ncbi:hypothetical protein BDV97DRAFT_365159 [Delphinella strobiligena]|nr:hypothetical protein BDV97DRAFT_365159 [Delphinella strobiligena]
MDQRDTIPKDETSKTHHSNYKHFEPKKDHEVDVDEFEVRQQLDNIPREFSYDEINIRTATRAHAVEAVTNGYKTMLSMIKLMATTFAYGQPNYTEDFLNSSEDIQLNIITSLLPIYESMQTCVHLATTSDTAGDFILCNAPAEKLPPSLAKAIEVIGELQTVVELLRVGRAFESDPSSSLWIEPHRPGPSEYQDLFQQKVRDLVALMDGHPARGIVGWVKQLAEQEAADGIKYWWGRAQMLDSN